jgi:hypothetical protein
MTMPNGGGGWVDMGGGYAPPQRPGQPSVAPLAQGQPQVQPLPQPAPWRPAAPQGAPQDSAPPYQPPQAQPQFQQQPGQLQPQPQPQPQFQQQAPPGVDLNQRLEGPNIPAEIRGKTIGEALQTYQGMRQIVLQMIPGPGPGPQSQSQQPPLQPQATRQEPQAQTQTQGFDWRNPQAGMRQAAAEAVNEAIERRVVPMLQPLVAQSNMGAIETARRQVAAEIPNYSMIEPQILQRLQGADPLALADPRMWRIAAHTVVGEMASRGQWPQGGAPAQPSGAVQQVAPGAQPLPNLNTFFTEAPGQGGTPASAPQLSNQQLWAAQQMGMTAETYAAWAGGIPSGGRR